MHTDSGAIIEGSLIVLNPDKGGASIIITAEEGRSRMATLVVRRDGVHLVAVDGKKYFLDGTSPVDALTATELNALIIQEMDVEGHPDAVVEYAIGSDVDFTPESEDDERYGPTP